MPRFRDYFRAALKSPIVLFALGSMILAAIGAPLFALSDSIH
jgi:hypothetical protein